MLFWIRIRIGKTFRILTIPDPAALTDLVISIDEEEVIRLEIKFGNNQTPESDL
jgi:hypothetical protein